MSVWDDPDIKSGDFVKFETIGDSIAGEILSLGKHVFDDGKVAAKLVIRTAEGDDKTLTAGQVQLKNTLAELRPEVGDKISVTYTKSERRDGGKTLKHFDVKHARGTAPAPDNDGAPF